jgi:hypothetical protein
MLASSLVLPADAAAAQALVLGLFCADERVVCIPDAFRQCYEAYTIYSFYRFIVAYIEDAEGLPLADVMAAQPPMRHLFPLRLAVWSPRSGWWDVYSAPPWRMGRDFLAAAEAGIMNYVLGAQRLCSYRGGLWL